MNPFRCPECGSRNHVFEALNESLLAISSDLTTDAVLQRIVDVARSLVHASYGAVGVRGDRDGFSHFIISGGGTTSRALLPLPAQAILADVLVAGAPYSTNDIQQDPRFEAWPEGYPDLKSFLGVPIRSGDEIVGAFYLSNENTWGFTPDHRTLVELLAPHAALAIKNARLYEQSRELSVVQERNRLARELHDSLTQTLFSMKLAAESATVLIESDLDEARQQLQHLQELARSASAEMRSLVFELRPPELEIEGLVTTLRKHVDVLRRVHQIDVEVHHRGERILDPAREREIFRVVQEALNNAIRHSGASEISIELVMEDDKVCVRVADNGSGFEPGVPTRSRRLGLTSMSERAQALGAELSISSSPGRGTIVTLELTA